MREISDRFAKHPTGCDYWFEADLKDIVPEGLKCPHCGGQHWRKETDILDVWFDSGTTWSAVLKQRPELRYPADLYLEGSDQHRGWFHSSLLVSIGNEGIPPYKSVLTHGYVVDGKGMKMSKSLGNGIAPQELIDKYGDMPIAYEDVEMGNFLDVEEIEIHTDRFVTDREDQVPYQYTTFGLK